MTSPQKASLALAALIAATAGASATSKWSGPGWYQISYSIGVNEKDPFRGTLFIESGPFLNKRACEQTLPPAEIVPALFTFDDDIRVEYWCDEEREFPLWDRHRDPNH